VLANLVHFLIGLGILVVFFLSFGVPLTLCLLGLPLSVAILFLFTTGLTFLLAGLTVNFRDIQQLLASVLLIWFFMSPILYRPELLGKLPWFALALFYLNPMAHIILVFQDLVIFGTLPDRWNVLIAVLWAVVVFWGGWRLFSRMRDALSEGI
jgi:lipopolysaccharide transport system permease protein